jgi:O-antigen/teichoic acid export membrane protein
MERSIEHPENLGHKLARGSLIMISLRALVRLLGLISIVIVARLIPPADIGISALAAAVMVGVEVFHNMGLTVALIRKREVTTNDLNTVWSLSVARGCIKALLIAALAPYAADFFGEPRLTNILYILGATAFCTGFSNTGTVEFHRKLQYSRLFWLRLGSQFAYLLSVIVAAVVLRSYWALIIGIVTERLVGLVLGYLMHEFRPRLAWKPDKKLFAFSMWYWIHGIVSFFSGRSDMFIISRMIGMADLGSYTISKRLANVASAEISGPVAIALRPGYARLSRALKDLRRVYLYAAEGLLLIGIPVVIGLLVATEPLMWVLFGPQWVPAAPLVQILASIGIIRMLLIQNQTLLLQVGAERLVVAMAVFRFILLLPSLYVGAVNWGLIGAAGAVVLSTLVLWICSQVVVSSRLEIGPGKMLAIVWHPLIAGAAMGLELWSLLEIWPIGTAMPLAAVKLCAVIAVAAGTYLFLVFLLWIASGRPEGVLSKSLAMLFRRLTPLGAG